MNQIKDGTIVKIKINNEFATVIRHSMITDVRDLGIKERDALLYAHYMVMSLTGIRHIHQSQLEIIWSPD